MFELSPKKETWEAFGENIQVFLKDNGDELKNLDIIIGFTRGGMILASILSTLLRDKYSKIAKAKTTAFSLRPLPSGITIKTYREPCFDVGAPMCQEDEADAENLIRDLEAFQARLSRLNNKMQILLVDDNLTGATRIFAYKHFLNKRLNGVHIRTLAYTRASCFRYPLLDYQIIEYPETAKYFIMPWHAKHEPLELPKSNIPKIHLFREGEMNLNALQKKLKGIAGFFGTVRIEENKYLIFCRGASIICIISKDGRTTIRFILCKYYPPKQCLESKLTKDVDTFHSLSLCGLGAEKCEMVCFMCSTLNCNSDLLQCILETNLELSFEVRENQSDSVNKSELVTATENWLQLFTNLIIKSENKDTSELG